jgi:hypothetical protein
MIGVFVMQAVAIHPGNRIDIDPEGVIQDRDCLYDFMIHSL